MSYVYSLDCSLAKEVRANLDAFTFAYIEAMMWTLTDEDGGSCDHLGLHDISAEAIDKAKADCAGFQRTAARLLEGTDPAQAGHDFWLTRNGHGTGFWDRDASTYPNDPKGEALTRLAHAEGEAYATLSSDGFVYLD